MVDGVGFFQPFFILFYRVVLMQDIHTCLKRVGMEALCTDRYTVTTRMTPALRWAATRAILMFHNCEE